MTYSRLINMVQIRVHTTYVSSVHTAIEYLVMRCCRKLYDSAMALSALWRDYCHILFSSLQFAKPFTLQNPACKMDVACGCSRACG